MRYIKMQQNVANIPKIGDMYAKSPQNVVNNSPQNQVNDLHIVNSDSGVSLVDIPPVLKQMPDPNKPKPQFDTSILDLDKQNQIIGLMERFGQILNSTQIQQSLPEKLLLGPTSSQHLSTMFNLDFNQINNELNEDEKLKDGEINFIKTKLESLETPTGQPNVDLSKGLVPLWAVEKVGELLLKEGKIKEANFLLRAYEKNIKLNSDKDKKIAYVKSFIGYGLTIGGLVALCVGGTWTLALCLIGTGFSVMLLVGIFQKLYDRSITNGEKNVASDLMNTLNTLKNNATKSRDEIKNILQGKVDENKKFPEQLKKQKELYEKMMTEKDNKNNLAIKEKEGEYNKNIADINKEKEQMENEYKKKLEELEAEKNKKEEEIEEIKKKYEEEKDKLTEQYDNDKNELQKELEDKNTKSEEEINDLKQQLDKLETEKKDALNNLKKRYNNAIENCKKKIQEIQPEFEKIDNFLQGKDEKGELIENNGKNIESDDITDNEKAKIFDKLLAQNKKYSFSEINNHLTDLKCNLSYLDNLQEQIEQ